MEKPLVAFIGLSHLGLVASCCWTNIDKPVLGIDIDKNQVDNLQNGHVSLSEPGLQEYFNKVKKDYQVSTDFSLLKKSNIVFISKDTSIKENGESSTKKLDQLIYKALPYLKNRVVLVLMSQVPLGYCRGLENRIREKRNGLNFTLFHWVDTIIMTNAIDRFLNPERIILGASSPIKKLPTKFTNKLTKFKCPIITMSFESAEVTKAAINLYLATSVAFANTLGDYCEAFGANINEIIPALQTDKRIGPFAYLRPGLRISGGHLERDLVMLKKLGKSKNINLGIVNYILKMNKNRYNWVTKNTENLFQNNRTPVLGIWGLAYKKNTDSIHNAASVKILNKLKSKAKFKVYDPQALLNCNKYSAVQVKDKYDAITNVDCLIILTDWEEFKNIDQKRFNNLLKGKLVVDATGILAKNLDNTSFKYVGLGVGNSSL